MPEPLKLIARAGYFLVNGEFGRLWALAQYRGLPKYFAAFRRMVGRYPDPVDADTISRDPILIYQMAKVGSKSVLFSLRLAYLRHRLPDISIHHVHNLQNLDEHEAIAKQSHNPAAATAIVREYKALRLEFDGNPRRHWNVISLIRDPVARQAGAFFHNLDEYIPNWRGRWASGELSINDVIRVFLDIPDHAVDWLDRELIPVLKIDVYAAPFPTEIGYGIYSNPPKADLLLIRLEDLGRTAATAIQQLLGIEDFTLYPANIGDEKEYADIYKAFKATPLPSEYVERVYQTRFARHFYTEAERRAFMRKWTHAK